MLNVKKLNKEDLTASTTFNLASADSTPFGSLLKLSIPKSGAEPFRHEVVFLPSTNGNTIMKPIIEVSIASAAPPHKFVGRYFLTDPTTLEDDPVWREKWRIYQKQGRQSTPEFHAIKVAHGTRSKFLINAFTLATPNPKDLHKVKLCVYGAKIAECMTELTTGDSQKWPYDGPASPLEKIFIVPVRPGMQPSAMYEAARFIDDDKGAIAEVHAKLNTEDLYDIDGILSGDVDCGMHVNPTNERKMNLLERAGYLVNGVPATTYEPQADGGYTPPPPPEGNSVMGDEDVTSVRFTS